MKRAKRQQMHEKRHKTKPVVVGATPGGEGHQVLTITGGNGAYRRKPCPTCPWRKDMVGEFPAEAFRVSAHTAYDMATHVFGCHKSGASSPSTCAGFLINGAAHNLSVRMSLIKGTYTADAKDGGHELHGSYRAMAIANGVSPDDPVLEQCRD